ncbi:hypothetical protein BP00DRAFT_108961 [Aspergillus indologenus CBS 114.80]|uniref:Uncharacterized protein n=1 Tax=Aspergillus indologenus CBS 114.80 TaxID=1450541 RepID=A0A2V5IIN1_9EURO|nr:hypothetical protein BP00DRAFT_108961 [Aspergillus indologenus CBS 114.80]
MKPIRSRMLMERIMTATSTVPALSCMLTPPPRSPQPPMLLQNAIPTVQLKTQPSSVEPRRNPAIFPILRSTLAREFRDRLQTGLFLNLLARPAKSCRGHQRTCSRHISLVALRFHMYQALSPHIQLPFRFDRFDSCLFLFDLDFGSLACFMRHSCYHEKCKHRLSLFRWFGRV